MDAKEARKKSLEITGKAERSQYDFIKSEIALAVGDQGKLECYTYKYILPAVKAKLEAEGFNISSNSFRNELTNTISW